MISLVDRRFYWPFPAAILILLAVGATGRASHTEGVGEDPGSVKEWMHGVPHGCRLVSFDLLDMQSSTLNRKAHVRIYWTYSASDESHETAALINNIDILDAEPRGISRDEGPILRVTVALTPRQAHRLKLAAACGTLRIVGTTGASPSAWNICRVEDRTQAIEARLTARSVARKSLERPTLAVPTAPSFQGARGVITVPVEIEFQR